MIRGQIVAGKGAWLLWQLIRLPFLTFLAILEPPVRVALTALGVIGVVTAFALNLTGAPHFPFLAILGASIACRLMLTGYHALLRVLDH